MDKKLRNRTLLFLLLAGIVAFVLIKVSGRQPVAKISDEPEKATCGDPEFLASLKKTFGIS